jgi:hypothetical protein
MGDQMRGGGEDMAGRAVVALQPDDLGAGKIMLEAQDVVDLGAAPAIDRLVVVADAADVLRRRVPSGSDAAATAAAATDTARRWCPDTRRRGCSGSAVILLQHVRMLAEQADTFEQQVAEIAAFSVFSRS